jgi:hypothetical protein
MNFTFTLFVALLFGVLSPGVLLSLPSKGSLLTKVLVHSVVFAVVFYLTAPMALQLSANVEGFRRPSSPSSPSDLEYKKQQYLNSIAPVPSAPVANPAALSRVMAPQTPNTLFGYAL